MEDVNTINNIAAENVDFSMFALFMAADLVVKSVIIVLICLLYTSPSPRDRQKSRMPSSA